MPDWMTIVQTFCVKLNDVRHVNAVIVSRGVKRESLPENCTVEVTSLYCTYASLTAQPILNTSSSNYNLYLLMTKNELNRL